MRLIISNIELESIDEPPWQLKQKNWDCYLFTVTAPADIIRGDLQKMVGELLHGKLIRGIESYAVERQINKKISIAIDA